MNSFSTSALLKFGNFVLVSSLLVVGACTKPSSLGENFRPGISLGGSANVAPVATDLSFTTLINTAFSDLLVATDRNSDALVFTVVGNPTLGTVTITNAATGAFTFTPNAGIIGTDTFTFTARDSVAVSAVGTVTVTISNPANTAPTLTTVSTIAGGNEDAAVTISYADLAAASNEADVDGDTLSFRVEAVSTGTLTKGGVAVTPGTTRIAAGESFVWTPAANANGTLNAFTVKAWDGALASAAAIQAQVSITAVNDAPTLTTISTITGGNEDAAVTISYADLAAAGNEADVDGDTLSFRVEAVSTGTLTKGGVAVTPGTTLLASGESLVWTPAANANGTLNAFTLKAWDGALASSTAIQTQVSLTAVNDAPTLTTISTITGGAEDAAVTISYATLAAAADEADVDGDTLSFRVEAVSTGTLTKGGVAVTPGTTLLASGESLVWTPAANANGTLNAFTLKAWDGALASSTAIQTQVSVSTGNDAPTLTTISTITGGNEDVAVTISYADLAAAGNEADVDGDTLSFRVEAVSTGTLTKGGVAVTPGTTLLASGESLVWTPAANANGTLNAFTLKAWDGALASSTAIQTQVSLTAVNDAPTLTTISTITGGAEDAAVTISYADLAGAGDEADVDGDTLSFRVEAVSTGTLTKGGVSVTPGTTLLASGESLVWTPAANANGTLNAFTLKAWDGALASSTAIQTQVSISTGNDAPTLTTISTITGGNEDVAVTISYADLATAGDEADVDGDTLSFRVEAVSTGTLTKGGVAVTPGTTLLASGESLVWTPAANANGTLNAFTLKAWDGALASSTAIQTQVSITAVNDAPTLTTISTITGGAEDAAVTISYADLAAAADEADVEGDALSFRVEAVSTGTLTKGGVSVTPGTTLLASGESLVWTPAANANGTLNAFTIKAWDGALASSTAIQTQVSISTGNDAPTLTTISTITGGNEDVAVTISYADLATAGDEADVDGDTLSFRVEAVSTGTLTKGGVAVTPGTTLLASGESLVWTPAANANGTLNAFTLKAWDGALASATAIQTQVSITAVNDAPTLTTISTITGGAEDAAVTISYADLTGAGDEADVDGDTLSFRVEAVSTGTLTKGGVAVTPGTTLLASGESLVWTPAANANGTLNAFTLKAWDGTVASATAIQTQVSISTGNDAPTLTTISTITGGNEDVAVTISYADLATAGDEADVDGDTLSFRVEAVSTGTLTKGGVSVTPGTTLLASGESLVWTPAANANGTLNAFTLKAWDGALASSAAIQTQVSITAVNDTPTLTTISTLTGGNENDPVTISYADLATAGDEADVDGDTLSFRVEAVSTGTLTKGGVAVTPGTTLLASGESLVWTPANNANGTLNAFTLKAWDGALASATAIQAQVSVTAVNAAPTLTTISTITGGNEDAAVTIAYADLTTAGDEADTDGDTLSFRVEAVSTGTLTKGGVAVTPGTTLIAAGESLVWTPAANANGTLNAFTLKAWDGTVASSTAIQAQVSITAVNDAPVLAVNNTLTLQAAATATLTTASYLSVTDVDNTAAQRTFTVGTAPTKGLLKKSGVTLASTDTFTQADVDGSLITYVHSSATDAATDSFTFTVSDGAGGSIALSTFNFVPVVAPQTLSRISPAGTPGNNTSLNIRAEGGSVTSGRSVQFYTNSGCTAAWGSAATANGSNQAETTQTLTVDGSYLIYASVTVNSVESVCSSSAAAYVLERVAPAVPLIDMAAASTTPDTDSTPSFAITLTGGGNYTTSDVVTLYEGGNNTCNGTARGSTTLLDSSTASVDLTTNSALTTYGAVSYYAKVTDEAGNSTCTSTGKSYTYRPAAPTSLTRQSPTGTPGNDTTPTIRVGGGGVVNGATVTLYSDSSCSTSVSAATASTGATVDVTTSVLSAGAYSFYATVTKDSTTSACSAVVDAVPYTLDTTAPAAPAIAFDSPASSPGTDSTPAFTISLTGGVNFAAADSIELFDAASCGGSAVGSATGITGASTSIAASAQSEGSTTYSAKVTDEAGNATCSSSHLTVGSRTKVYVYDNTAPTWAASLTLAADTSGSTTDAPAATYTADADDGSGSGIASYWFAIGTGTSGASASDVVDWDDVSSSPFTATGTFSMGTTYYLNMRAKDNVGLYSAIQSDSWTVTQSVTVAARYSIAPNWMDHAKAADTTQACVGTEGNRTDCIHGGELKKVDISFVSDCTGVTMTDNLGWMDWTCVDNGATITFNGAVKSSISAKDFINFNANVGPTFKTNYVTMAGCGGDCPASSTAAAWWTNTLKVLPVNSAAQLVLDGSDSDGGGVDDVFVTGTLFTYTGNATVGPYVYNLDKLGIVLDSASTLTNSGTIQSGYCGAGNHYTILCFDSKYFGYFEGALNGGAIATGSSILLHTTNKFSFFGPVSATNSVYGIQVGSSRTTFKSITATGNSLTGLQIVGGSGDNHYGTVIASTNGTSTATFHDGIYSATSTGTHTFSSITASSNGGYGVRFNITGNVVVSGTLTASSNGNSGVYGQSVGTANWGNVTANSNGVYGMNLVAGTHTVTGATTNSNTGYGLYAITTFTATGDITANSNTTTGVHLAYSGALNLTNVSASTNTNLGIYIGTQTSGTITSLTAVGDVGATAKHINGGITVDGSGMTIGSITVSESGDAAADKNLKITQDNNTIGTLTAYNNTGRGVGIESTASGNTITTISSNNDGGAGAPSVDVGGSTNRITSIYCANSQVGSNSGAVNIYSTSNYYGKIVSSNAVNGAGVLFMSAVKNVVGEIISTNHLYGTADANKNGVGIKLETTGNFNSIGRVVASNNANAGIINWGTNNVISQVTAVNNKFIGIRNLNTAGIFNNVLTAANGDGTNAAYDSGLHLTGATGTFSNIAAVNNYENGVESTAGGNYNVFNGTFIVGNNGTKDCLVSSGTAPGIITTTCSDAGTDGSSAYTGQWSTALLRRGAGYTTASSFIGKISNDATNTTDDADGTSTTYSTSFDFFNFENIFRTWGLNGSAFPNTDHRGRCASGGECRIWDWSLSRDDSKFLNKSGNASALNDVDAVEISGDSVGDDDGTCEAGELCANSFDAGSTCPTEVEGTKYLTSALFSYASANNPFGGNAYGVVESAGIDGDSDGICESGETCEDDAGSPTCSNGDICKQKYLSAATEIMGDSIGDDDGLCESSESCVYTPNFGAYQGHGTLVGPCTFNQNGGVISGVSIYGYPNNGR